MEREGEEKSVYTSSAFHLSNIVIILIQCALWIIFPIQGPPEAPVNAGSAMYIIRVAYRIRRRDQK